MNRRIFLAAAAAASRALAAEGWIDLFNGRDMSGWRPSEHKSSWKIADGCLAADGPRSHLFYAGPAQGAIFRNFELEVETLAHPYCNSGVYFHTAYQETGFPVKGFEIQINNTALGEGGYLERKKTGSLYGVRNIYRQIVADDRWFKIHALVRGKNVQIRLDSLLVVDYTEPDPPVIPDGAETGRFLSSGTFALQCHNDGSKALFRSVRVRPLPDAMPTPGPIPKADDVFRLIIQTGRHNLPMVDYHVQLTPGFRLEDALRKSRRDGISYGVVFPEGDDAGARAFASAMKGEPVFAGLLAGERAIPPETVKMFDYVIGASGAIGKRPLDICTLAKNDDFQTVIAAAAKNRVAIEINDRSKLPERDAIRAAQAAGCRFAFGTGNTGPADLGRSEYGLRMVEECKLGWQDFFIPEAKRV